MPPLTIQVGSISKTISSTKVNQIKAALNITSEQELMDAIVYKIKEEVNRDMRRKARNSVEPFNI